MNLCILMKCDAYAEKRKQFQRVVVKKTLKFMIKL